jgi:hypothetical protein
MHPLMQCSNPLAPVYTRTTRAAGSWTAHALTREVAIVNPQLRRNAEDIEWVAVTKSRPCQVCGAHEGCRTRDEFACCTHRVSDWPLTNGAWLHRLDASCEVNRVA